MVQWDRVRNVSSNHQNVGPSPSMNDVPINLLIIRVVINVEVGNQSEFHVKCSNLRFSYDLIAANPDGCFYGNHLCFSAPDRNSRRTLMARQKIFVCLKCCQEIKP